MQFRQRQGLTRVTLLLREEDFVYEWRRGWHRVSETFPYHGWPFEGEAVHERQAWLCRAGWLCSAIAVAVGSWRLASDGPPQAAALWLLSALGLHGLCAVTTRHCSRFMVGPFPVLLLRDARHDTIAAELARRRTACLRRDLIDPPLRARPQVQQRRLDWLRASGVISDAEYQQASLALPGQSLTDARRA